MNAGFGLYRTLYILKVDADKRLWYLYKLLLDEPVSPAYWH